MVFPSKYNKSDLNYYKGKYSGNEHNSDKIKKSYLLDSPRIALLGCGGWGKNLMRIFHNLGALKLVCDPVKSATDFAEKNAPRVGLTDNFNDVIKSSEIDALVIATPADTHFELAARALDAGKDVFVEKPLALDVYHGEKLKQVAEKNKRILMVGHLLEYHPAILKLQDLIKDNKLGVINYIYSNRLNFGKIRIKENALWSFAPHDMAVILRLIGEMPVKVTCNGGNYLNSKLADVTVSTLEFSTGQKAHVFVSWLNPFKEQKLVVMGDRRMAVFDDVLTSNKLKLYDQKVDFNDRFPVLNKFGVDVIEYSKVEPLKAECEHFIKCIQTRKEPLTNAKSGVDVLKVLKACQESLTKGGTPIICQN